MVREEKMATDETNSEGHLENKEQMSACWFVIKKYLILSEGKGGYRKSEGEGDRRANNSRFMKSNSLII